MSAEASLDTALLALTGWPGRAMQVAADGLSEVRNEVRLLAEARAAWRAKLSAESNLDRLRGYKRMTAGMKADKSKALRALGAAEATLSRVLGGGL